MTKMKNTALTLLKTLFVLLVLSFMIVAGIFLWNLIVKDPVIDEPLDNNQVDSFEFSVVDYEYFKFEDLDFNILITTLKVNSKFPYSIPLSKLRTSENVYLNDIDSYLKSLQDANYKPSDSGLVFSLDANENELEKDFILFVPVKSKNSNSIELNSLVEPYSKLSFDLTDSSKWGDTQKLVIEGTITSAVENISAVYEFMDYYIQSNFYTMNGDSKETTVDFPTNTKVLGVKLKLSNKSSEIQYKISKARIIYPLDQVAYTIDPNILLPYETNLLTQTIDDSADGVLFFLVPSYGTNLLELNKSDITIILELSNGESITFSDLIGN